MDPLRDRDRVVPIIERALMEARAERVVALDPDRLIPIIEQAIQREACVVPFGDYRRAAVAVFDALNGGGEDVS